MIYLKFKSDRSHHNFMKSNFYRKEQTRNKVLSFSLLISLFILRTVIPPLVTEVSASTPIESTQVDPNQLIFEAQTLYQQGKFQATIPLWEKAAQGFAQLEDHLNQAVALSNLSLTYQQLENWDAADQAIVNSLNLLTATTANNSLILAQTLDIQGELQRKTGKLNNALKTWQKSADIHRKTDNLLALAQNNLNQAQALQELGLYDRACKQLLNTISLEEITNCQQLNHLTKAELATKLQPITANASITTVSTLRNLGDLLLMMGQPKQSEQILLSNLDLAKKLNSPQELGVNYLSLGNTYQALAEQEKIHSQRRRYQQQALDAYNKAASLSPAKTIQVQV